MKSIFDLDYDEDDAPAMDHRSSQTIQVEIHERRPAKKAITLTIPQDLPEFKVTEDAEPPAAPIITTWECVEDEECVAGQHQRQQGVCCAQDVELLHECYVEGLNGNWNGLPVDKCPVAPMFEPPCADIDYEKHSLYKRVVPSCNHLLMDKLPKVNASASEDRFSDTHSRLLSSFSELSAHHRTGLHSDSGVEFREWFELLNVPSFNDDTLTILPYVVID